MRGNGALAQQTLSSVPIEKGEMVKRGTNTKLAGVDPHRYVLEATRRAIASPGTATLPKNVT